MVMVGIVLFSTSIWSPTIHAMQDPPQSAKTPMTRPDPIYPRYTLWVDEFQWHHFLQLQTAKRGISDFFYKGNRNSQAHSTKISP
jgi:hypothetical protein